MGHFLKMIGAALALTACAQSPETIAPTYVTNVQYQSMTCPQLELELARLNGQVAALSDRQRQKRVNDVVGWIFSLQPTASIGTTDIRPQIALHKGEQQAVHNAMMQQCAGAGAGSATGYRPIRGRR